MKANELRIGNLLIANNLLYRKEGENKIACVVGIDSEKEYKELKSSITIYHIDDEFKDTYGQWIKHLEPIPLTEEWLIKFGFEKKENSLFTKKLEYIYNSLKYCEDYKIWIYYNDDNDAACNSIADLNFVHELQNLYFALTKKELTMK